MRPPEMVDRVASAIQDAHKPWSDFFSYPFEDTQIVSQIYRGLARAALEAMREPTAEITRNVPYYTRFVWKDLIDAALKELPAPHQKMTCDHCGADLTGGVRLQAAQSPRDPHNFCGYECLGAWQDAKTNWGVGNSFEYDPFNMQP